MGAVPGTFSRRKESQAPNPRKIEVETGRGGILFAATADELGQHDRVRLAHEVRLALFPVERLEHLRHRLSFGVIEVGETLENVVGVESSLDRTCRAATESTPRARDPLEESCRDR